MPPEAGAVPERLVEEAAGWLVRLDGGSAADERAALDAWLAADPRHAAAFAEARRFWAALDAPVRTVVGRRRRRAMLAGGLALLATGSVWGLARLRDAAADLATDAGERRTATLADGSTIELDTDTAVAVAVTEAARRLDLLRGRVFLEVAHDPARPFTLGFSGGEARVLGTAFSASDRGDGTGLIAVTSGRVRLASGAAARNLPAGEVAELRHGAIGPSRRLDPEIDLAWRHGRLVVVDRPLAEVVAELERYRGGRILLAPGPAALAVTGVFRTDDTDAALAAIAGTLSLRTWRLPGLVILH